MKNINLINTISPKKYGQLKNWFLITSVLCVLSSTFIFGYSCYQLIIMMRSYLAYQNAIEKAENTSKVQTAYSQLQAGYKVLNDKSLKMNTSAKQISNPYFLLQELSLLLTPSLVLTNYQQQSKDIIIEGKGLTTQEILNFIERLNGSVHFRKVKLTSLQEYAGGASSFYGFSLAAYMSNNSDF